MSENVFTDFQGFLGNRLFNNLINISLHDSYVWFKNPKVASSTLEYTLQNTATRNITRQKKQGLPHVSFEQSVHVKPYQLNDTMLDEVLSSDKYFKFTFVRNPYSRLISAYNNKIVGNLANKAQILRFLKLDNKDLEQEVSFDDFILSIANIVEQKGETSLDNHWLPQSYTTGAKWIKHDFIGQLENFDRDIGDVFDKLKIDLSEHYNHYKGHDNPGSSNIDDYLGNEVTLARINKIYALDFELFDYDMR